MSIADMHPLLFSDLLGIGEQYKHVFYTWLAMAILFTAGFLLKGRTRLVPTGLQNFFEVVIGGLEDFTVTTVGEQGRKVFPILCGIFLFIITCY